MAGPKEIPCDHAAVAGLSASEKPNLYRCRVRPGVTAKTRAGLNCLTDASVRNSCAEHALEDADANKHLNHDVQPRLPRSERGELGTDLSTLYEDTRFS